MDASIPDARAQISGLAAALLLVGPDHCIAEANPAAEEMIGKSENRLRGMPLSEILEFGDEQLLDRLLEPGNQLVAGNVPLGIGSKTLRVNITKSSLPVHPGWHLLSLTDASGDVRSGDATENGTLQAPAILAHEIKNPLAAIRGAGQLLERKLDPSERRLAQMITGEVDRITRLIDRMQPLGTSRTDPLEAINLHQSVRNAITTVQAGCAREVKFTEEFDPSLPPVRANHDILEQILINLLSNALDATENTSNPEIIVRTRFVSGFAAKAARQDGLVPLPVEITVADNGPGIAPELAEHIFEPFVTAKAQGQGLGLALVKKLVGDMQGRVTVMRDKPGGLTEFRLHLALAGNMDSGDMDS